MSCIAIEFNICNGDDVLLAHLVQMTTDNRLKPGGAETPRYHVGCGIISNSSARRGPRLKASPFGEFPVVLAPVQS